MKTLALAGLAFICALSAAKSQSLSADDVASRAIHRRAVEAVIWGMPVVNFDPCTKRWSAR
jgi:hypothetical protein